MTQEHHYCGKKGNSTALHVWENDEGFNRNLLFDACSVLRYVQSVTNISLFQILKRKTNNGVSLVTQLTGKSEAIYRCDICMGIVSNVKSRLGC